MDMHKLGGHKGHHHRQGKKEGGRANDPAKDVYEGKESEVLKEAEEKNAGGRVGKKHGGEVEGEHAHHMRRDRPHHRKGRKRGGRTGSDKSPLTSAAHGRNAEGHKADTGMADDPTKVMSTDL